MTLLAIAIAAGALAAVLALRALGQSLNRLHAQLQTLVASAYPLFTHEAIEEARRQIAEASSAVERRSAEYRENRVPQVADVRADCQRWHELQRADVQLLHARELLDAMVAGNAAIRLGTKTLTQVRNDLYDLHDRQLSRWSDHLLEMNLYDVLALDGGVRLSKLKNGHKLLVHCFQCEAETSVTAQQLHISPALQCSQCKTPLDEAAVLFVHPDQATRLGRVQVERHRPT